MAGMEEHPVLAEYLRYTRNTESPALFHIWSFLSGISACMGRRTYYQFGSYVTLPNMYVLLSGPVSMRKSSAINPVKDLLAQNTGVRFAPSDTGGHMQGLIEAMLGNDDDPTDEDAESLNAALESKNSLDTFFKMDLASLNVNALDTRDPNSMYAVTSALSSVIGENSTTLLNFLQMIYDGETYKYKLRRFERTLTGAVLGILAGTTAASLAQCMSSPTIGQGFMARAVIVYADESKIKRIARPSLDDQFAGKFSELFSHVNNTMEGRFQETPEAAARLDAIYQTPAKILDPRLVHWAQRRHTHLQKLVMTLAASRKSMTIELCDVEAAQAILSYTEEGMTAGLGDYGMNKAGAAKSKMIEMLISSTKPRQIEDIVNIFRMDMTEYEARRVIDELIAAGRVSKVPLAGFGDCIIGVSARDARRQQTDAQRKLNDAWSSALRETQTKKNPQSVSHPEG